MKATGPADFDWRHFRFVRTLEQPEVVEIYEPKDTLRWAFAVVAVVLSLLVLCL